MLWSDATVVAIWRNGSFRVQVGADCEWIEDFPSPASVEGRRLLGREWRVVPGARAAPAVEVRAADVVPLPSRRTLRSQAPASSGGDGVEGDEDVGGDDDGRGGDDGDVSMAVKQSARQLGDRLVGLRVSVWWEEDEMWYRGKVRSFGDALGEHLVCYDDGEQRQETLDECRWRLLSD